jgi:hypothetical protein
MVEDRFVFVALDTRDLNVRVLDAILEEQK